VASVRERYRKDGTPYWAVLYNLDGKQTSTSLTVRADADAFCELVNRVGAARALQLHGIERVDRAVTVAKWVTRHIDGLSGIERRTEHDYRAILRNDITPTIGHIPLTQLTREDIAAWLDDMRDQGASGKTISNKHRLLSAALKAAHKAGAIPANPAAGLRLPRTERLEMRFLSRDEFATLLAAVPQQWQPMVRFLVASGARLSEATALRPSDVNRAYHTVRISRAWKRGPGGYTLGAPKTVRSVRTINIPPDVLDALDYSHDYLFTGRTGKPVHQGSFRANVWWPAVAKAKLPEPRPRIHDLRHTCASWLIQAGIPLPVIQQHLGHESIEITVGTYGHLDRRSAQAAADVIGKLLG
jgi:integrase